MKSFFSPDTEPVNFRQHHHTQGEGRRRRKTQKTAISNSLNINTLRILSKRERKERKEARTTRTASEYSQIIYTINLSIEIHSQTGATSGAKERE
jgi:predicted secreted protein